MKRSDISPMMINIGFGNLVAASKVVAIVSPGSEPMKRLRHDAREAGRLIDATAGRRARSIIVTQSGHVILSSLHTETIATKFNGDKAADNERH